MRRLAFTALLAMALGLPHVALSNPVSLRLAVHPGFTRLVFDFRSPQKLNLRHEHGRLVLGFPEAGDVALPAALTAGGLHNIDAASRVDGGISLSLPQGVTPHSFRLGNRAVLDLIDATGADAPPTTPSPPRSAAARKTTPIRLRPLANATVPQPAATPVLATPSPVQVAAAAQTVAPPPASAEPPPTPGPPPETVARTDQAAPERGPRAPMLIDNDDPTGPLVLSFAPGTGAASFMRGAIQVVVFDQPRAIDLASLHAHPGYEHAEFQLLPQGAVLRVRPPPGQVLALSHNGPDWTLAATDTPPAATPITCFADAGKLHLAAAAPGHVLAIPDPLTGDTLLVGTLATQGAAVNLQRRTPEFIALPTLLGVAIDPLSDRVALHQEPAGFVVEGTGQDIPLALSATPPDAGLALAAARMTRSFDLPNDPTAALLRRLHGQTVDASVVPLASRLPQRRAVAQTMLALGMGPEAEALLQLAATDDPRSLADPAVQDLSAAAALLAGRLDETAALSGPPPPGGGQTDERRLWQALRQAARLPDNAPPDPETVAAFEAGLPLLLSYPPTLRSKLLPLVADTLLRGHAIASADRLLAQLPIDPALALARAVNAEKHGQHDQALAAYDALTQGRDRSARARAALLAIELRLADRRITQAQAADAMDKLTYSWRGDARELALRLRVADLRHQAGNYRQELQALREAVTVFPEQADSIKARLNAAFAAIVGPNGGLTALSPLDTVSLIQENADLLPDGAPGEAMSATLADRLAALDLPLQAGDVLGKLMHDTASASAKAALGARLAALRMGEQQAKPALDALDQSQAPGLSPALTEQRALIAARAHAALGDHPAALANVAALTDPDGQLARASVQEDAHDWPGAAGTLSALLAQMVPATGALNAAQSGLVLRLASAAAQAGDEAALARLRLDYATRLPDQNDASLLALLTEPPVRNMADLPRAAAETSAARSVPKELQAMK